MLLWYLSESEVYLLGMPVTMRITIVRATLVLLFGLNGSMLSGDDTPQSLQRFPDFTLPDIATEKAVSLSDYRGRKVLLIQFASW